MNRARGVLLGVVLMGGVWACGGEPPAEQPPAAPPTTAAPAPAAEAVTDEDVEPLLVWADSDTDEGPAPLTVKFMADVEGGKPPLKHVWTFGDETPDSNEPDPAHTYEKPGYYQAELFVTDASGDEDSDFLEIEVLGDEEE